MKKIFSEFKKKSFVRNVLVLASGTAMAQIITFILLPLITRIYGPEQYGLLGAFVAIAAILIPVSALTFPIALVLTKDKEEAASVIILSIKVIIFMVLISTVGIYFFHESIVKLLKADQISEYLYLLPLIILFSGIFNIVSQWLIKTDQYKLLAKTTIYQPLISYGSMLLIGSFYPFASVLIVITTLKTGISSIHMLLRIKFMKSTQKINLRNFSLNSRETFVKYKDFPLYRAPEVFISSVTQNFPVLLLTALVNPTVAGFYVIGRTTLAIPAQLIGKAVGDVFYPRIAKAALNKESIVMLLKKSTIALIYIGVVPFGFVILAGPVIFPLVFGESWSTAGEYAQWISLMSFSMFISRPSVHVLPVINAQRFQLIFTVVTTVLRITTLYFSLAIFKDALNAIALFSVVSAVGYISLIIITYYKSTLYMKSNY